MESLFIKKELLKEDYQQLLKLRIDIKMEEEFNLLTIKKYILLQIE